VAETIQMPVAVGALYLQLFNQYKGLTGTAYG
jgi:hypothetical protein